MSAPPGRGRLHQPHRGPGGGPPPGRDGRGPRGPGAPVRVGS
ncbi:hypothetical protein HMPREF0682_0237 [Propionibacterium acidifaciens F0233]|uniref:Uncharacterized protein n=1 Tax=Propionibacterium acidifaciens F0233 TaxID=553198 RepID=U2RNM2_9ACTN|nr:hypothetical protein HMPREF0682_0237 [Propionibacterium acidifaciens F0233]